MQFLLETFLEKEASISGDVLAQLSFCRGLATIEYRKAALRDADPKYYYLFRYQDEKASYPFEQKVNLTELSTKEIYERMTTLINQVIGSPLFQTVFENTGNVCSQSMLCYQTDDVKAEIPYLVKENENWSKYVQSCLDEGEPYADNEMFLFDYLGNEIDLLNATKPLYSLRLMDAKRRPDYCFRVSEKKSEDKRNVEASVSLGDVCFSLSLIFHGDKVDTDFSLIHNEQRSGFWSALPSDLITAIPWEQEGWESVFEKKLWETLCVYLNSPAYAGYEIDSRDQKVRTPISETVVKKEDKER